MYIPCFLPMLKEHNKKKLCQCWTYPTDWYNTLLQHKFPQWRKCGVGTNILKDNEYLDHPYQPWWSSD